MSLSLFLTFRHATAQASAADLARAAAILGDVPGVTEALLFTPATSHDPYLDPITPPALVIQLGFAAIEPLEAALHGRLPDLATLASLDGAEIGEQAMLTRRFPVPDARFQTPEGRHPCTYLVAYEGEAEDLNAWLSYYIRHHPSIMARFPGIRGIEIYSRLDWCSPTGWQRETAMQRNKVVFDSPEALTEALNSPVRHEMRADFRQFPPFTGTNSHFPMWTRKIV